MSDKTPEELLREVGLKLRLGKLDSLFLLIPTVLGIVLSLLQFYLGIIGERSGVIAFIPILVIGIGFPIYIGYYRGGIKLDSIVERARGWIYLLGGIPAYVSPTVQKIVEESIPTPLDISGGVAFTIMCTPSIFVATTVGSRILSLFGIRPLPKDMEAFKNTGRASLFLGASLSYMVTILTKLPQDMTKTWILLLTIPIWALPLYFFSLLELSARQSIRMASPRKLLITLLGIVCILIVGVVSTILRVVSEAHPILGISPFILAGGICVGCITLSFMLLRKLTQKAK